jgi:hypothetical protein
LPDPFALPAAGFPITRGGNASRVSAPHFLASSTVMAEALFVIDPAVTKSNAAGMSFGLIIAYSPAKSA